MPSANATELWRRVWERAKQSWTMLVAAFLVLGGLVLDVVDLTALIFNMPEMQAVIIAYTGPYASHALKFIGVLVAVARTRSLMKA